MSEKKVKNPPKIKIHQLTFEQSKEKISEHLGKAGFLCVELMSKSASLKQGNPKLRELIEDINAATSRVMSQTQWHEFFWNADGTRKQELPEIQK